MVEREILIELQRAGIQVIEQQGSLELRDLQITGHIDAVVVWEGESIPIDVKTMSDHTWHSTFKAGSAQYAWEEVQEAFSRKSWLRKYLAQVTLYCLLRNCERGILLCTMWLPT